MENAEYSSTCDFCNAVRQRLWFTLKACRNVGTNVVADYHFQLCQDCYTNMHYAIRKAVHELFRQRLLDRLAEIKQELQAAAGLDNGQQP
jgi:hypothetical protein